MNRLDAKTVDVFKEANLSYINEKNDIASHPVSKEVIENSKNAAIIGKIGGYGANCNESTRNGRKYVLKLWQNVEADPLFQEGLETHTIVGELDHPDERIDYALKEGAVVLTDFKIQNDGNIYTQFDILNTLPGRMVKTYFDAGCKLGVSSRGLGEEIVVDGETIIDPDTYAFFCFDVVAQPALKSARMELLESTSTKHIELVNSIKKEIKNSKTLNEVLYIEQTAKDTNLYLDEIRESIELKKEEIENNENKEETKKLVKNIINNINKLGNKVNKQDSELSNFLKDWLDAHNNVNEVYQISDLFKQLKEETNTIEANSTSNKEDNNKIKISDEVDTSDKDMSKVDDKSDMKMLVELNDEIANYKLQIDDLNNQITTKNEVIQNLICKTQTTEKDNIKKEEIIQNLLSQKEIIKEDVEENIDEEKELNKQEQEEIEDQNDSKSLESKDDEDKKQTDVESQKEIEDLKQQLNSLNDKYTKLQKTNNELSNMLLKVDESKNITTTKFKDLQKKHESLDKQFNELQERINKEIKLKDRIITKNSSLKESLNSSNFNIKELNSKVSILTESENILKEKNNKLLERNKQLINDNKALKQSYINSLDKYIESICNNYNLNEETLKSLLGE